MVLKDKQIIQDIESLIRRVEAEKAEKTKSTSNCKNECLTHLKEAMWFFACNVAGEDTTAEKVIEEALKKQF